MKSTRCEEVLGALVAHGRGELKTLERERVRSHLGNCAACASTHHDLDVGLAAARSWQPDVSMSELDILGQRLHPYMQPRQSVWPPAWAAFALSGAALASVIALGVWVASGPWAESTPSSSSMISLAEPSVAPAPPADAPDNGLPGLDVEHTRVARTAPAPHLRLLNGGDWDGEITRSRENPKELVVTMTRGFAVFSFEGGAGRRLSVSTPDARVEVVGTRFFVEAHDGVTTVGVASGKVRVLTLSRGMTMVDAGERLVVGEGTRSGDVRAAAYLDDPYLIDGDHLVSPAVASRRTRLRAGRAAKRMVGDHARADVAAAEPSDLFAQLRRAEELARLGEFRLAIAGYRKIATDARPSYAPYRDLSRYEIARLWGFRLGEIQRARSILRPLANVGAGEVARQATLALCELDLRARPCAAAACLRDLTEQSADFQLGREAGRLLTALELANLECTNGHDTP